MNQYQQKYVPQPGTIPAKVIAHLSELPEGTELSTAVLLEVLGQPTGWVGLTSCLRAAVDGGVLQKRLTDDRRCLWRLADPTATVIATGPDDHTAVDDSEPGNRPRSFAQSAALVESQLKCIDVELKPITVDFVGQATAPAPAEYIEVAITSEGRLLIDNGTDKIALSPAQLNKLYEYTDAQRGIEWEAA